jgi:hypothetical protein
MKYVQRISLAPFDNALKRLFHIFAFGHRLRNFGWPPRPIGVYRGVIVPFKIPKSVFPSCGVCLVLRSRGDSAARGRIFLICAVKNSKEAIGGALADGRDEGGDVGGNGNELVHFDSPWASSLKVEN